MSDGGLGLLIFLFLTALAVALLIFGSDRGPQQHKFKFGIEVEYGTTAP